MAYLKPKSVGDVGTTKEWPFSFLPVKRYPLCACEHSKWVHWERVPDTLRGKSCLKEKNCACEAYKFHRFQYYWDPEPISNILSGCGRIIGVILLLIVAVFSVVTLLWIL